jgi:hypothetical protein
MCQYLWLVEDVSSETPAVLSQTTTTQEMLSGRMVENHLLLRLIVRWFASHWKNTHMFPQAIAKHN